ncbi:B12-binding domain-containing radical SAM protein [Elusimicrobiota bacterium]
MNFLLINPFIYDFACYDYWMKPLGLLYLSSILKERGHGVELIDCMDRHHPDLPESKDTQYGQGSYYNTRFEKPVALNKYPRKYSIYGMSGDILKKSLQQCKKPDLMILTSTMTYWYPAVKDIISMLRTIFPDVPAVLGGVYSTLCYEHAKNNIPADHILPGNDFSGLFDIIEEDNAPCFSDWPAPDYSYYRNMPYVAIRTSIGCYRHCSYCGIKSMGRNYVVKSTDKIEYEIEHLSEKNNTRDIVFYDESLLENRNLLEYLESSAKNLRFHTPNGIEVNKIDKDNAELLKKAGFIDPCLAIDVLDNSMHPGSTKKSNRDSIEEAVEYLHDAGYQKGEVSAYLIMGLPGQGIEEIRSGIEYIHGLGLKVKLAEYAIVPGSRDSWNFSKEVIEEPLFHNNSIFPSYELDQWDSIFKAKGLARKLNNEF